MPHLVSPSPRRGEARVGLHPVDAPSSMTPVRRAKPCEPAGRRRRRADRARHCARPSPTGSPRAAGRSVRTSRPCSPWHGGAGAPRAAGGAHRRREDAGRVPAEPDRAHGPARRGLHTLYVSPLKALAADVARNLGVPVAEMGLAGAGRDAHRRHPAAPAPGSAWTADILLTTPESLALMLSYPEAPASSLASPASSSTRSTRWRRASAATSWCSASPGCAPWRRRRAVSACPPPSRTRRRWPPTCARDEAARVLGAARARRRHPRDRRAAALGRGRRALRRAGGDGSDRRRHHARVHQHPRPGGAVFEALWRNCEDLPIGLHHGSLDASAAPGRGRDGAGRLRAVVATGCLDLGIDWGDVDLVIQVGAPKNVKRLVQRIGRANHRLQRPLARAVLVPANRFEVLECRAALDAVREHDLDGEPRGPRLTCSASTSWSWPAPARSTRTRCSPRSAAPAPTAASRARISTACLEFAATGGYALRSYDRWQRLVLRDGLWSLRDPRRADDPDERRHHRRHR